MRIAIDKRAALQYLSIYLSIQYIGGRLATYLGSDIFAIICLAIGGLYFISNFNSIKEEGNYILFLLLMSASLLITVLLTSGGLSIATSLNLLARFLIVYVAIDSDRSMFLERFLKVCFVFACISLVLFAFVTAVGKDVAQNIFARFLVEIKSSSSYVPSSYGLVIICYNFMNGTRNSYMFGEPGEYQMLMMLALYLVAFHTKGFDDGKRRKYFIVFLITMLTTQSATGYMSLLVFAIYFLFTSNINIKGHFKAIIVIAVLAIGIYSIAAGESSFVYENITSKLFDSAGEVNLATSTGRDRVTSILDFIQILRSSPSSLIFGMGYSGIVSLRGGYSCSGIINTFIMLGFFSCVILYGFLLKNIFQYTDSLSEKIFLVFMIINNGLSQPDLLAVTTVITSLYLMMIKRDELMCNEGYLKDNDHIYYEDEGN